MTGATQGRTVDMCCRLTTVVDTIMATAAITTNAIVIKTGGDPSRSRMTSRTAFSGNDVIRVFADGRRAVMATRTTGCNQ